ncbi:MAG: hypothetical protein ACTSRV_12295 [Candidatus Freyarchaeota archaeon]
MPVDIYLKICYILGIKKDLEMITRWRTLKEDIAMGEWYHHPGIDVRINPDDLKEIYENLFKTLNRERIPKGDFLTYLNELNFPFFSRKHIKKLEKGPNQFTISRDILLVICEFLGKNPSELRELERGNMSENDPQSMRGITLSRKVARLIHLKAWRKYGQDYIGKLAEIVNPVLLITDPRRYIRKYLSGEWRIPLAALEKIEKSLDIKIPDALLHMRKSTRKRTDYTREVRKENDREIIIEKIEIFEPNGEKRTLLTFIHTKEKEGGGICTEIPEIGKKFPPTEFPWILSPPDTRVTVNRTREFRDGKDLITYIVEKSIEKAGGNYKKAAMILGISPDSFSNYLEKENGVYKRNTIILKNLLTLALYVEVKISEITDHIEKVGILDKEHNPHLTVDLNNADGAFIVMAPFGDGSFVKYGEEYFYTYHNEQKDFVENLAERIKRVYGINPGITKNGDVYVLYIWSKQMGKSLERVGVIPGKKVRINPNLPKFIIEGSKWILKSATKVFLADEMAIHQNRIIILNVVDEPRLIKYRDILDKIEGIIKRGKEGEFYLKKIFIKHLKDYEEIINIAENKESNILEGVKKVIISLLEKYGVKIEEKSLKIKTEHVNTYSYDRVSVTKVLYIEKRTVEKLHEILGGYPGYKELMYANWASLEKEPKLETPLSLTEDEIEKIKSISTLYNNHFYRISLDDDRLPEELRKRCNPPQSILEQQKKYSNKEVEILVEGKSMKVKGMPSRIKGEIILCRNRRIVSWKLIPALVREIKKKWKSIRESMENAKQNKREGK